MNADQIAAAQFIENVAGSVIEAVDVCDEGMHLYLADGRVLIFVGTFVVGILAAEKQTLQ